MAPDAPPRIRLTRSGVLAAVAAALCLAAGRVAGIEELSVAGLCLAALVICSLLVIRIGRGDLAVDRVVRPRRVEVGDQFVVGIRVHNGSSVLRLPISLSDTLDGSPIARLTLPQRRDDPACVAEYALPAVHRGVTRFGPLHLRVLDPFGFARLDLDVADLVDVIVLPRIHHLRLAGAAAADDPSGGLRRRRQVANVSEEFDALRDYVPGDDVRRVHWASTARLGRPVVRTHQQPAQRRTTVILDDRAMSHPPILGKGPFERAVSAAASVLVGCRNGGDLVRLVIASGHDSGYFDDHQRLDSVLDQLAAAHANALGNLRGALATTAALASGDRVVVCCGVLDDEDRAAIAGSAANGGQHIVIGCGAPADLGPERSRSIAAVDFTEDYDLGHQWQAALRGRSSTGVASATAGVPR